jgi:hypothetical protein
MEVDAGAGINTSDIPSGRSLAKDLGLDRLLVSWQHKITMEYREIIMFGQDLLFFRKG